MWFLCICNVGKVWGIINLNRIFNRDMSHMTSTKQYAEKISTHKTWRVIFIMGSKVRYRTRAIISRGLYFFTPFFTAAYTTGRLIFLFHFLIDLQLVSSLLDQLIWATNFSLILLKFDFTSVWLYFSLTFWFFFPKIINLLLFTLNLI